MNGLKPAEMLGAPAGPAGQQPGSRPPERPPGRRLARLAAAFPHLLDRVIEMLKIPEGDTPQLLKRIEIMERDITLPLKAAGIAMVLYSFYRQPWIGEVLGALEIAVESTRNFLWVYIAANLVVAGLLLRLRKLPLGLIQWVVFVTGLTDGIFLSALTVVTGGYHSFLYWLFLGLIVRSAVSVPRATSQLALNFTIIACYVLAGVVNLSVARDMQEASRRLQEASEAATAVPRVSRHARDLTNTPARLDFSRTGGLAEAAQPNQKALAPLPKPQPGSKIISTGDVNDLSPENLEVFGLLGDPAESLLVRLALLLLMTVCAYGVQVLLERQRQAEEEAREFAVREVQLHAAGRLAAEFAHQIKNPLAIINTAAFSLQRVLKKNAAAAEQVEMIQEEVERADRIITEVMGYAQLSEGHVERLNVVDELDHAIERVFPPAARFPINIHRNYAANLPPLLVQRRHAVETFINVLQNAREALEPKAGNVFITARRLDDHSIEVSIRDDGPGIPPDKLERVFQAYYTTKPKGTGLGLATVKHNLELYGGSIRVESELGKGARFVLLFPAKTLMNLARTTV